MNAKNDFANLLKKLRLWQRVTQMYIVSLLHIVYESLEKSKNSYALTFVGEEFNMIQDLLLMSVEQFFSEKSN